MKYAAIYVIEVYYVIRGLSLQKVLTDDNWELFRRNREQWRHFQQVTLVIYGNSIKASFGRLVVDRIKIRPKQKLNCFGISSFLWLEIEMGSSAFGKELNRELDFTNPFKSQNQAQFTKLFSTNNHLAFKLFRFSSNAQ